MHSSSLPSTGQLGEEEGGSPAPILSAGKLLPHFNTIKEILFLAPARKQVGWEEQLGWEVNLKHGRRPNPCPILLRFVSHP